MTNQERERISAAPWTRVLIMVAGVVAISALSYFLTGTILPEDPRSTLIYQNALLLVVLGSAIIEHKFTKPADALINALMGMITLLTVYRVAIDLPWWLMFGLCALVFLLAAACVISSEHSGVVGWKRRLADLTYRPAVELGASRRLFSVLFLYAVFSFYQLHSRETVALVVFWGIFVVLWPLRIPELLTALGRPGKRSESVGRVVKTEAPDLIRVALEPGVDWTHKHLFVCHQAGGEQRWVLPLYSQLQDEKLLGTGLCLDVLAQRHAAAKPGAITEASDEVPSAAELLGGTEGSELVGFIVEGSSIGQIRFEMWDVDACHEGTLVWCKVGAKKVFYQITGGVTHEEQLETDKHGFQIAEAVQLGTLGKDRFEKFTWMPQMNTPVFSEGKEFGEELGSVVEGDFAYGVIPNSKISIGGDFTGASDHHTAILGITGSGKTELAFDLIRHALEKKQKVICIDLTSQYRGCLSDLARTDLTISDSLAADLGAKLFDVETGSYGAGEEKKALEKFSDKLREDIRASIEGFLTSKETDGQLGIIELNEISNTKATLYITEIYMSCLLKFAKEKPEECPRVLIVVEEAHTVMPEAATMGLGDYGSKGLVGKIAQIALQGRKYRVGLLVLAQRTATVSKSVLTQCNTIVSFACYDDTSLGFLSNMFGAAHVRLIPNLPRLHAVAFGRGVRSDRPVVIEIPYDPKKDPEANTELAE